jgi:hypothetical protein
MKRGMGVNVDWREVNIEPNLSRQMEPPIFTVAKERGILSPMFWGSALGGGACVH